MRTPSLRNMVVELTPGGVLTVDSADDPMVFWEASRRFFLARRPVKVGAYANRYPETTNDDVRQLAIRWNALHLMLWRADVSQAAFRTRWRWAFDRVMELTASASPAATFPRNEDFWLVWTKRHAIWLSAAMNLPTRREQIVDALVHTAADLPGDVVGLATGAAGRAADAVAAAGNKVGKMATAPVRGLFSGLFGSLGRPLLIGALVVGGFVVVPRLLPPRRPLPAPEGAP